jgi:hypothetical protein
MNTVNSGLNRDTRSVQHLTALGMPADPIAGPILKGLQGMYGIGGLCNTRWRQKIHNYIGKIKEKIKLRTFSVRYRRENGVSIVGHTGVETSTLIN